MKKIIFVLFIFCQSALNAQQVYNLTLEESIEIAKDKSLNMQILAGDLIIEENNLKATVSQLRTNVSMNFTLPQYTETVREWEDSTGISFFPVKTLRGSTSLNISQPLPTDGRIYIQTGLLETNDYYTDLRASQMNTRIGLSQPIDALYGYNSIRSSLKRAQLNYERANKVLKREELNLIYQVSSSYYRLLSLQKGSEIALLNLERQKEAYEISKNKHESGLIREVEALQMEVDLAEAQNNYEMSLLDQSSATNSFKEQIGLNLKDSVTLNSELKYNIVAVDPEKAIEMALQNRLEIRENEIQIELQKLSLKQQKAQGLPSANLDASIEKIGVNRQELSNSLGSSVSNSWNDFNNRPANFQVGLSFQIPIIDWGRNRALVRAAEERLKQNMITKEDNERTIETEVRNLVASLQNTLNRLILLEKNVSIAERSFEITLQRYTDGDIDSQSLALERNRLNSAQKSHLEAYISYQLSIADLMRKTFYDFENQRAVE